MLKDIVSANPLGGYRLHLRFEDGVEGVVDLGSLIHFRGIFAPLQDPGYFAQVRVDRDLGSVSWPNGADVDPDVLYGHLVPDSDDLVSERTARFDSIEG
jgi:hypothetical protein